MDDSEHTIPHARPHPRGSLLDIAVPDDDPAGSAPEQSMREETIDDAVIPVPPVAKPMRTTSVTVHRGERKGGRLVAATLVGAALGVGVALVWPKSYVATAELLIDPAALVRGDVAQSTISAVVDNQVHILESGTMLDAAAERLNLAADPEFNGAGGVMGEMLAGLGALLGGDAVEQRDRRAVDSLADAVTAQRAGGSTVIGLSARTSDPEKSALVANTLADLYLADAGGGTPSQRLTDLRAGAEEAREAAEAFRARHGLTGTEGLLGGDEAIVRLGERLSEARARTVELNARAASTRDANVDSVVAGSLPEQYASATLAQLRSLYAQQKQQVDRLSARLGPRHPELLSAQAELEGAREEIAGELRRVAASLQTELTRAVQQEQELAAQLAQMKSGQSGAGDERAALRELERTAEMRGAAYEQALSDSRAGAMGSPAARMISRAAPPRAAATPSLPLMTLAGALAGLAAGIALTARRRDEVEVETVDIAMEADDEDSEGVAEAVAAEYGAHARLEQAADEAAEAIARRDNRLAPDEQEPDEGLPEPFLPGRNPDGQLRDDDHDHHAFAEDREDAAIEEIRQILQEFRAAVEDLAENRQADRRYGT